MRSESFRKGVKDGIPIGLGYFAVSFTFGMMAVADGLSIWQAVLISLTNVTSAGQFAVIPPLTHDLVKFLNCPDHAVSFLFGYLTEIGNQFPKIILIIFL